MGLVKGNQRRGGDEWIVVLVVPTSTTRYLKVVHINQRTILFLTNVAPLVRAGNPPRQSLVPLPVARIKFVIFHQ